MIGLGYLTIIVGLIATFMLIADRPTITTPGPAMFGSGRTETMPVMGWMFVPAISGFLWGLFMLAIGYGLDALRDLTMRAHDIAEHFNTSSDD